MSLCIFFFFFVQPGKLEDIILLGSHRKNLYFIHVSSVFRVVVIPLGFKNMLQKHVTFVHFNELMLHCTLEILARFLGHFRIHCGSPVKGFAHRSCVLLARNNNNDGQNEIIIVVVAVITRKRFQPGCTPRLLISAEAEIISNFPFTPTSLRMTSRARWPKLKLFPEVQT